MRYNVLGVDETSTPSVPVPVDAAPSPKKARASRKPRVVRTAHDQFAGVPDAMIAHLLPGVDLLTARRRITDHLRAHPEIADWRVAVADYAILPDPVPHPSPSQISNLKSEPDPVAPSYPSEISNLKSQIQVVQANVIAFPAAAPAVTPPSSVPAPAKSGFDFLRLLV